jgi:hypothetical protein
MYFWNIGNFQTLEVLQPLRRRIFGSHDGAECAETFIWSAAISNWQIQWHNGLNLELMYSCKYVLSVEKNVDTQLAANSFALGEINKLQTVRPVPPLLFDFQFIYIFTVNVIQ